MRPTQHGRDRHLGQEMLLSPCPCRPAHLLRPRLPPSACTFTGTSEQLQAEVDRLRDRLKRFTDAEPSLAAIQPDGESDLDGTLLSLMREWRGQRLAAIEFETQRLEAILAATSKKDEL